jgi:rhamnogalacturonyl hydrolase YesR
MHPGLSGRVECAQHHVGMRYPVVYFVSVLLGWDVSAASAEPDRAAVVAVMERVADWQLAHPPGKSNHGPTDWTMGALYAGVMALADVSASPRFDAAMVRMAEANAWKTGPRPYHADDYCVGQTYAELYLRHHVPGMIEPLRAHLEFILAHPKAGTLDFTTSARNEQWSWCDSLFMGPPTWMRLYAATGNAAYLDFVVTNWWRTSDYLYDQEEHLYYRDSTYFPKREANGKKVFWSRGNGWVMAGLARVLEYLPADHSSRPRFVGQFREMAARIREFQQADGLWRSSLLDPENYPLKETSGSGFYCYALAWGVRHGLLDRATYEPVALRAWQALTGCVDAGGKLTHVQPIGADPKKFDGDSTETYGVGAFLLAGSEICRLGAP